MKLQDDSESVIATARRLAIAEHRNHKHGTMPYEFHLTAVVGIVCCYTRDLDVIAAAWLHDIVEDCADIDLEVVEQMTNRRVRDIVDRLTDPPGPRVLAKQVSLPRILQCPDASLIKLADRYHNHASTIIDRSEKYAKMYLAEFDAFVPKFLDAGHCILPLIDNVFAQRAALHEILHDNVKQA